MKVPEGMTETEVVEVINKVVNALALKFRFGYSDVEDIKQQGRLFAIKVLEKDKYDPSKPLANFLYRHVRNQLINYKRNNYIRNEPPCKTCVFFDPHFKKSKNQCGAFTDKSDCKKFKNWERRNAVKKNIIHPVDIDEVGDHPVVENDEVDFKEFEEILDRELPIELRSDYLRMRQHQHIPKARRKHVQSAVLEVLKRYHHEDEGK